MLSRNAKALFYLLAGPVMRLNGALYRQFRAPREGRVKVQLGPGREHYLPGWINVDANAFTGKCDVWADLRYPLPFRDGTVDALYSHHVIEHLPDLPGHFAEAFRVLKPGGVYRVGGPNAVSAAKKLIEGDRDWFPGFPDDRASVGGRYENFLICRGEHLTVLTEDWVNEIAGAAGFPPGVKVMQTRETGYPELFADCLGIEYEVDYDCPRTLMLEFVRP